MTRSKTLDPYSNAFVPKPPDRSPGDIYDWRKDRRYHLCEECQDQTVPPCWQTDVFKTAMVKLLSWVPYGVGWWRVLVLAPTMWQMRAILGPSKIKTVPAVNWPKVAITTALDCELGRKVA